MPSKLEMSRFSDVQNFALSKIVTVVPSLLSGGLLSPDVLIEYLSASFADKSVESKFSQYFPLIVSFGYNQSDVGVISLNVDDLGVPAGLSFQGDGLFWVYMVKTDIGEYSFRLYLPMTDGTHMYFIVKPGASNVTCGFISGSGGVWTYVDRVLTLPNICNYQTGYPGTLVQYSRGAGIFIFR